MSWRLALILLACAFVAGCADSSNSGSDDNHGRFGGFYSGVNGGVGTGMGP